MRLVVMMLAAVLARGTDYVSLRTGDWNDPGTWGVQGSESTHGVPGSGDRVKLRSAFTITCPAGATCVAGDYPAGDSGTPAIQCESNTGTAHLAINGTLRWQGPVRGCAGSVTVNAGGALEYDSSGAVSPTSAGYTWSFANASGSASHVASFVLNGTSGNPVQIRNTSNANRSGGFGYGGTGQSVFGNGGNFTCNNATFSSQGITYAYRALLTTNNRVAGTNCRFTGSAAVLLDLRASTAGIDFNMLDIDAPSTTSGIEIAASSGASPANGIVRRLRNSRVQGRGYVIVHPADGNTGLTVENFLSESNANSGWRPSGAAGTTNDSLFYDQYSGSGNAFHFWENGVTTASSQVRLVNAGVLNVHPSALSVNSNYVAETLLDGLVFDGNSDHSSDMFEVAGNPASVVNVTVRNNVGTCNHGGTSIGSHVNYDGPAGATITNTRITYRNNTWCSSAVTDGDLLVMANGMESSITFGSDTFASVDSSLFWRTSPGPVRALCFPADGYINGFLVQAGAFGFVGHNASHNGSASGLYCATAVSKMNSGPAGDIVLGSESPRFLDASRNFVTFDRAYLGDPPGAQGQWTSGRTYSAGDVVWDQQAGVWNNAAINWRATASCVASGTNRPVTGTGWTSCWEPATLNRLRALVLSGATYDYAPMGASGVGILGVFNRWVRHGYTAQNPKLWGSGLNGSAIGTDSTSRLKLAAGASVPVQ